MDSEQQRAGERRVRDRLVQPLLDLGLSRPKGFTKVKDFDAMVEKVLCPKLAYMTAINLDALVEQIAANPAGRGGDQIPIPAKILSAAADIQPPSDEASALMLAIFANDLGRDAIAGNFAPELLRWIRKQGSKRHWPKGPTVQVLKQEAEASWRRIADIEQRRANGHHVSDADERWLQSRDKAYEKCREIARLAEQGGAA